MEAPELELDVHWRSVLAGAALPLAAWAAVKLVQGLLAHARAPVRADATPYPSGLKVVITGSTRGLGLALARHFLALGDDVVVNGRSAGGVDAAVAALREEFPGCHVVGIAADVSQPAAVDRLVAQAAEELGQIDMMVCNAALSAKAKAPAAATPAAELAAIAGCDLAGALLCARAAVARMLEQPGGGKVFLVEGAGSRGGATPGNAAYGATKAGLRQLGASLAAECRGSAVGVHLLSPGMVATDLLLRYADNPRSARVINILAEEPATVAAWLVPRMRGVRGNGARIAFLTPGRAAWRFATASRRRGRFVPEGAASSAGYQRLARTAD